MLLHGRGHLRLLLLRGCCGGVWLEACLLRALDLLLLRLLHHQSGA
jgi:hypothetical protein